MRIRFDAPNEVLDKSMIDLAIAYRIYPGVSKTPAIFSEDKLKLSAFCLQSFKRALGNLRVKIWVLLDGCPPVYDELFKKIFLGDEIEIIRLQKAGNFATFSMQLELLSKQQKAELVYFAEDDYFYFPDALAKMVEFIRTGADVDFVTPYDHPYAYQSPTKVERHLIRAFGDRHWRTTSSTCLTFLARKGALLATRQLMDTFSLGNDDGSIWMSITQKFGLLDPRVQGANKERVKLWLKTWFWGYRRILFGKAFKLWEPLPSLATHIEAPCLAPVVDWNAEFRHVQEDALRIVEELSKKLGSQ